MVQKQRKMFRLGMAGLVEGSIPKGIDNQENEQKENIFFFNGVETATGKSMKGRMSMSIDRRD